MLLRGFESGWNAMLSHPTSSEDREKEMPSGQDRVEMMIGDDDSTVASCQQQLIRKQARIVPAMFDLAFWGGMF